MRIKKRLLFIFGAALSFLLCFPATAFANSSWRWISETRPYDVLPFVIIGTLIIETSMINYIPRINRTKKVFGVVLLGNALSFAAPYIAIIDGPIYTFSQALENWPTYTIGFAYLTITIVIELPLVYNLLKKQTVSRKTLFLTILAANIITTILTAIAERIFCYGQW